MANIVFNIAKGRGIELHGRVVTNDPVNSALVLIPLETSGLETDLVLTDKETLAQVLAGTTNEQTTMGRKYCVSTDFIGISTPDHGNDRNEAQIPTVIWAGATGNPISKLIIAYDPDTTSGTDADIIPITMFDFLFTPDGSDIELTFGIFFRAQQG